MIEDILRDEAGNVMSTERVTAVRRAFTLLNHLADHERGLVLCWFCRGCNRYVGPGDRCNCERDE